jgi:putative FmdB family regulatory protein
MPTYQYRCTACDRELEVVQKFTDDALTVCPECSGALRKVYNAVGVVFKGSGFYATDNRTKGKASAAKGEPAKAEAAKSDSSQAGAAKSGGSTNGSAKTSAASSSTGTNSAA